MIERAFKVASESKLYKDYFEAQAEKQKLHDIARVFFEKHDLLNDHLGYYMREDLAMQLTDEQQEKYKAQLKKYTDSNGMFYFKKSSAMYKEWQETVTSKVDFSVINKVSFWYWPYIGQGQYSLWHHNDELYGYLSDYNKDILELPEYFELLKMSEYYAVKEARI